MPTNRRRLRFLVIDQPPGDGMTDAEKLNFLDHWLTDLGQTMRELSAAIERLYDRVNRETGVCDTSKNTHVPIINNSCSTISTTSVQS